MFLGTKHFLVTDVCEVIPKCAFPSTDPKASLRPAGGSARSEAGSACVRMSSSGTVISAKTHTEAFCHPLQMWRSQNINDLFVQAFAIQYSVTALCPDDRATRQDGFLCLG